MDLTKLLGPSGSESREDFEPSNDRPDIKKHHSSINDLVNKDDSPQSSSPIPSHIRSPVMSKTSISAVTPHQIDTIRARSSISSLTNDIDVGIDGKETPSIARRLSYELSASESNSPVLPKKTIGRQSSLQEMINVDKPIEFEEPVYDDDEQLEKKPVKEKQPKKEPSKNETVKQDSPYKVNKPKAEEEEEKDEDEKDEAKPKEVSNDQSNGKQKLKSKPKRYSKPPIWATKWISPKNRHRSQRAEKAENPHLVSITGVKPYNDFTRRVSSWIYSQIESVPKEQRHFLELEIKFGKIWDKTLDRRINIPVTNEIILDKDYASHDCYFKPGLEKNYYEQVKRNLVDMTKRQPNLFRQLRTDQIDRQYREAIRGEIPKFYRITFDSKTNRIVDNIEKRRIGSLFIHTRDLKFDYRISVSVELPSKENPERFANQTPESERQKKRISIFHDSTATRFDLTSVVQKSKKQSPQDGENLEVELEIDMNKLLDAFNSLDTDSYTFEDMSEILLDNARILNRKLEV